MPRAPLAANFNTTPGSTFFGLCLSFQVRHRRLHIFLSGMAHIGRQIGFRHQVKHNHQGFEAIQVEPKQDRYQKESQEQNRRGQGLLGTGPPTRGGVTGMES